MSKAHEINSAKENSTGSRRVDELLGETGRAAWAHYQEAQAARDAEAARIQAERDAMRETVSPREVGEAEAELDRRRAYGEPVSVQLQRQAMKDKLRWLVNNSTTPNGG